MTIHSDSVGNAAAMREALEHVEKLAREFAAGNYYITDFPKMLQAAIQPALSAPPRNCDRFNSGDPTKDAADAYDEWQRHCDGSLMPPSCKFESAFRQWLLAPAKPETKGESNGSK